MNINHHDNGVQVPASNIIYGYYIKKVILNKLVYQAFHGTQNASANKIRIFIDITSIFRSIMASNCIIYNNYEVACAIINMVAHYKSFFIKGNYGVQPEFFLIYSNNIIGDIENKRNPYYCQDARTAIFSPTNSGKVEYFNKNITMSKLITQYLPDVYFMDSNMVCTPVSIYNTIKKFNDGVPNIVITKDPTMNQLTTISNTVIFRPKKTKTNDEKNPSYDSSYIVTSMNAVLDSLDNKNLSQTTVNKLAQFPPTYWSLIIAFNGIKSMGLERVFDIRNSIYTITQNYNTVGPIPTKNAVENIEISSSITGTDDNRGAIRVLSSNFDSIDIPYKYSIYSSSAEAQLGLPPTLFDNNGLKQINDVYFNSNGLFIDLMSLL